MENRANKRGQNEIKVALNIVQLQNGTKNRPTKKRGTKTRTTNKLRTKLYQDQDLPTKQDENRTNQRNGTEKRRTKKLDQQCLPLLDWNSYSNRFDLSTTRHDHVIILPNILV